MLNLSLAGAVSFVSSGSTACPAMIAIMLRAGWTIEGVQSRYIRYEAAGDQFVGRCVAGLLLEDPSFATLPPFFPVRTPLVSHAVSLCFPGAPERLSEVLEMVLASVVYHRTWLRGTCPTHPLFKTALFLQEGLADALGQLVECRLGTQADRIRATGIPPHIQLNCRMLVCLLLLCSSEISADCKCRMWRRVLQPCSLPLRSPRRGLSQKLSTAWCSRLKPEGWRSAQ